MPGLMEKRAEGKWEAVSSRVCLVAVYASFLRIILAKLLLLLKWQVAHYPPGALEWLLVAPLITQEKCYSEATILAPLAMFYLEQELVLLLVWPLALGARSLVLLWAV